MNATDATWLRIQAKCLLEGTMTAEEVARNLLHRAEALERKL